MSYEREEPFKTALGALRERLREGVFRPGRRIAAMDVAESLRLSATPVREALSRLAGEGLVDELRGQGFYVPIYTGPDVADLYRLSLAQLRITLSPERLRGRTPERREDLSTQEKPVEAVEQLFAAWIIETGGRVLVGASRRTQAQLAPIRRLEPKIFPDLQQEADQLIALAASGGPDDRLTAVERFHMRRIEMAEQLSSLSAIRAIAAHS